MNQVVKTPLLYQKALVWDAHSCLPLKTGVDLSPLLRHKKAGIN